MSAQALLPTTGRKLRGLELRSALLVRYGFRCCWCGGALAATDATVDHLIPLRSGGPGEVLENLAPTHLECNMERGHLPISDWLVVCDRRGWRPNRPTLARALDDLVYFAGTDATRAYAARELACMERDSIEGKVA